MEKKEADRINHNLCTKSNNLQDCVRCAMLLPANMGSCLVRDESPAEAALVTDRTRGASVCIRPCEGYMLKDYHEDPRYTLPVPVRSMSKLTKRVSSRYELSSSVERGPPLKRREHLGVEPTKRSLLLTMMEGLRRRNPKEHSLETWGELILLRPKLRTADGRKQVGGCGSTSKFSNMNEL